MSTSVPSCAPSVGGVDPRVVLRPLQQLPMQRLSCSSLTFRAEVTF